MHRVSIRVLVYLGLIAILVGLLRPIGSCPRSPGFSQAKQEMAGIIAAIMQYEAHYHYFPTSTNAVSASAPDFTFGTFGIKSSISITNATGYQANNSEVLSILLDLEKFGNGKDTINKDHARNLKRTLFLNAKAVSDSKSPGIGPDGVYRDPWGNPYIITLDLNYDNKCADAFYRLESVSQIAQNAEVGMHGLIKTTNGFEVSLPVVVWSLGPDGKANPSQKANQGVNKDNILSWK